jgi:anthraniloyl-CoA monooxygenase
MRRIVCVGGGPAGLYAAILLRKALPAARVEVFERNRPDDTFGWGVVFSDQTMANFRTADPESHGAILANFHHWDDIAIYFGGARLVSGGHGFCGIGRKRLLGVLQERARELGVQQVFQQEVEDESAFADADLIIAADGGNSRTRAHSGIFGRTSTCASAASSGWAPRGRSRNSPCLRAHRARLVPDPRLPVQRGAFHGHRRDPGGTWRAHGLDACTTEQSIAFCEQLFARYIPRPPPAGNAGHLRGSAWLNFHRVQCRRWHHGKLVLIGDAAHTAHFSIGSGTKLAMEDAICLSQHVSTPGPLEAALAAYQRERHLEVLKLQSAARNRMEWFEHVARYVHLPPEQFAYSLLTGSQRIGHDNLRVRDPRFVADYERWLAQRDGTREARPPMFLPFRLRDMTLVNRVVVSPMAQYSAVDGMPDDWHLVHYGHRALGGAGLVYTEMTCVSPEGCISPGCTGLWNAAQRDAWRRIVDFVHGNSPAKICLQLGHSGRKGSTQLGWEQPDHPLPRGNWPILAPSPLPYLEGISQAPLQMSRADMDKVREDFVRAADTGSKRASTCSSCTWRTGICSPRSCRPSPITAAMSMAAASRTACASRSRC